MPGVRAKSATPKPLDKSVEQTNLLTGSTISIHCAKTTRSESNTPNAAKTRSCVWCENTAYNCSGYALGTLPYSNFDAIESDIFGASVEERQIRSVFEPTGEKFRCDQFLPFLKR